MAHFSRRNSNLLAILSLGSIVLSKIDGRFKISGYEYIEYDPSFVKVVQGHMRLLTSDELD